MNMEHLPVGDFEIEDWGVDDRPGIRLTIDGEYSIGQVLGDGVSVTWTTPDTAAEAVAKCKVVQDERTVATVYYDRDGRATLSGSEVQPFLKEHDCWWVKLRQDGVDDYVVYLKGEDGPNELATLGPPLRISESATQKRVDHIQAMIEVTATPQLRMRVGELIPKLVSTIETA